MDYKDLYRSWLESPALSGAERDELQAIRHDEKEIESRFFAPLQFGTAGLRGVVGMGVNRMNIYTVRQATQAIANLIRSLDETAKKRGVAISYDCRINSREFAEEVSSVLAANGISVHLFDEMRPTPELSFTIRHLRCIAGINITASHNPKEYNGYKVYWEDGAQVPPEEASVIAKEMEKTDIFTGVRRMPFDDAKKSGLVRMIGSEIDEAFLENVMKTSVNPDCVKAVADDLRLVYTPFHGTGYKLVPEALSRLGCRNIRCVEEQMIPDGTFPTVKSPNPENKEGFALAIELAKKENIDLIIGTDPDADRIGVVLRDPAGEYNPITGNQLGVLLIDYLIRAKKKKGTLPKNAAAIKTIVTTEMARAVCERNCVSCFDTFTGFKFMAEKIKEFEETRLYSCIIAFEESYGYLIGGHVRDKDAVTAAVLITEMAAYYKAKNMTLYDALNRLFETYGYYQEYTINTVMPGVDGLQRMQRLMDDLRANPPSTIGDTPVSRVRDYLSGHARCLASGKTEALEISGSNVLYFELSDKTSFIVRPSGTEPKIKTYILASAKTKEDAQEKVRRYTEAAAELIK